MATIGKSRAVDLVLDSGAFSAWKRQIDIDVYKYIEFVLQHRDYIHEFVNLDVIPGHWGRVPSPHEVEESARLGFENAKLIQKAGLKPMPVFHMGERKYWLDKMIGEGFDYVGISPANDRTSKQKIEWLDDVFGHLCGKGGYPQVRTHGFGVTALPILFRYPWGTADSMTWMLIAAYGGIMVPQVTDGKYDYNLSPFTIQISRKAGAQSYEGDRHFDVMGEGGQKYVRDYVRNLDPDDEIIKYYRSRPNPKNYSNESLFERLRDDYVVRMHFNCRFFIHLEREHRIKPFYQRKSGLFNSGPSSPHGFTTNQWGPFLMEFTQNTSKENGEILTAEGCRNRLLSYFYFLDGQDKFDLVEYCRTGLVKGRAEALSETVTELPEIR